MEGNIFHAVAGKFFRNGSCYTLFKKNSIADKLNTINFEGATPLDVAIDYENWNYRGYGQGVETLVTIN